MTGNPTISDAEWEVMNVLWDESPRTAAEVADVLCERMQWNPRTVKTLLGRLVKKGVLRYKPERNRYLYWPLIPRQKYIKQESASFVDRVFGGESTPMLVHFVRNARLTKDEIDELRRILDEKEDSR